MFQEDPRVADLPPPDLGGADQAFAHWIRDHLPDSLEQPLFLLERWQWGGLVLVTFLGVVADRVLCIILNLMLQRSLRRGRMQVHSSVTRHSLRPLGLLAMAAVWAVGIRLLGVTGQVYTVLDMAIQVVAAVSGVWAAYRLVDVLAEILGEKAKTTESKFDDLVVPLVRKSLKVFILAVGLVFIASNLGTDVSGLLAGLGLGGLAIALAAQDTVKNLFGTVTVLLDRPFHVGDWVLVADHEGTIEAVGFRSTRIRTFYNSLVTVPNSTMLNATVDNYGQRRFRRWKTMLSVTYDTPPDRIEAFCEGIRELIRLHPYTRKDYYHVYLNQFAGSSLDVLLYMFLECPDWPTELRERQRLMLDILRLAKSLDVDFAFPTQTLHLETGGEPTDAEPVDSTTKEACQLARSIVEESTGIGHVPPPVTIQVPSDREGDLQAD